MNAPLCLARRDTFRLAALALALAGGASTLAACSDSEDPSTASGTKTDVDGIDLVSSNIKRAAGDPSALPDVVAGLQALTGDLFGKLGATSGNTKSDNAKSDNAKSDNLVISPYSVLVALSMTLTGAAGATAEEMRAVLGAQKLGDRWHKGVNALTAHIEGLAGEQKRNDGSTAEIALAGANQIFGQQEVDWEEAFVDLLAKEYGAGLRAVDFANATEQARTLINGWVEDQTNDRIVDLIGEGVLSTATRLVLVNAIYLKAPWEEPFEQNRTEQSDFTLADGSTVQVETMNKSDLPASVATGDGWRAARIAYAGQGLAMTIVLPDVGKETAVERMLTERGPGAFLAEGAPSTVAISLPKWTFRTAAPLTDVLRELGMERAFSSDADFTPMTTDDLALKLTDVVHQGFIAVDEEGTEAAAATAAAVGLTAVPVSEKFVVDRPFLFLIHDIEHATPLFLGRVADPTA
ncbi:MAG: serpin family protein [Nocardioidaceae bacterium]|nr:serpin family protein [Nocardioidaceae bacterium]